MQRDIKKVKEKIKEIKELSEKIHNNIIKYFYKYSPKIDKNAWEKIKKNEPNSAKQIENNVYYLLPQIESYTLSRDVKKHDPGAYKSVEIATNNLKKIKAWCDADYINYSLQGEAWRKIFRFFSEPYEESVSKFVRNEKDKAITISNEVDRLLKKLENYLKDKYIKKEDPHAYMVVSNLYKNTKELNKLLEKELNKLEK
jgi:hypothetical protein